MRDFIYYEEINVQEILKSLQFETIRTFFFIDLLNECKIAA
jgi:hypothetical protein